MKVKRKTKGEQGPRGKERNAGTSGPNVTFRSLCPRYNRISIAQSSAHHAPVPWQIRARPQKGRNSSSSLQGGAGTMTQKLPPKLLITSLPKGPRCVPWACPHALLRGCCHSIHLCLLGLRVSSPKVFCNKTRTYPLATQRRPQTIHKWTSTAVFQ